ncbi:MAG: hypothetical protein V3T15_02385, partial [Pseudomonadales bacterium]
MTHGDPFSIITVSRARVNAVIPIKGHHGSLFAALAGEKIGGKARETAEKGRSMNTAQWLAT